MRKILLAVSFVLALVLTGCSEPVTSGVVVAKEYTPAHDVRRQGACIMWTTVGETRVCTLHNYYDDHVPDKWTVTIAEDERESKYSVNESVFGALEVGDHFDIEGCLSTLGPENC